MIEKVLALILLIGISPLLLVLYLIIKLTSKGPFVFKQERMGKDFHKFYIYKIRTMIIGAERIKDKYRKLNEADGPVFKIKNDPRYTKLGKILAHSGLDELLQLINIIKGEMSFVGPRPLPVVEALKIPKRYHTRFTIKPGITSVWVVCGAHDLSFDEWMKSDLDYLKQKNIFNDITIWLLTCILSIKWNTSKFFFILYPAILLFYSITPYSLWWVQIFIFTIIVFFLGINLDKKFPLFLILFPLSLLISSYLSINSINTVPYLFSYLVVFILSLFINDYKKQELILSYIYASLIIGSLSTLYSLSKIFIKTTPTFLSFLESSNNLIIPYFGHSFYAIFLVSTLPFVMEKLLQKSQRYLWYLIFFIYLVFLFTTFSKAAIMVGMFEIIIFILIKAKTNRGENIKKIAKLSAIFILSIIILSFILISRNDWLKGKVLKSSLPSRLEYWQQSKEIISHSSYKRVIFGYGMDTFFDLSNKYQSRPGYWARTTHNFLLQYFVENGIFGVMTLLIFGFYIAKKSYHSYTTAEKIAIFSLIIFSIGGTTDLTNVFPILLLFFIILQKIPQDSKRNRFSTKINHYIKSALNSVHAGDASPSSLRSSGQGKVSVFALAPSLSRGQDPQVDYPISKLTVYCLISILIISWSMYLVFYSYFMFASKPKISNIKFFPYESAFWEVLIFSNQDKPQELSKIENVLKSYTKTNIELSKLIIQNFYLYQDYCQTLTKSLNMLKDAPYDLDFQKMIVKSLANCVTNKYTQNFKTLEIIKNYFDIKSDNLFPMYQFLRSIAEYHLTNKNYQSYLFWQDKAWRANPWNAEIFENINLSKILENTDKYKAADILEAYLMLKEKTNYQHFDSIRKQTAQEWIVLAKWYDNLDLVEKAKDSYKMSISSYPYDGDIYFQFAQFMHDNQMGDEIENIYNLCKSNFDNALWCDDIKLKYGNK